jgi:hypothetical protein
VGTRTAQTAGPREAVGQGRRPPGGRRVRGSGGSSRGGAALAHRGRLVCCQRGGPRRGPDGRHPGHAEPRSLRRDHHVDTALTRVAPASPRPSKQGTGSRPAGDPRGGRGGTARPAARGPRHATPPECSPRTGGRSGPRPDGTSAPDCACAALGISGRCAAEAEETLARGVGVRLAAYSPSSLTRLDLPAPVVCSGPAPARLLREGDQAPEVAFHRRSGA